MKWKKNKEIKKNRCPELEKKDVLQIKITVRFSQHRERYKWKARLSMDARKRFKKKPAAHQKKRQVIGQIDPTDPLTFQLACCKRTLCGFRINRELYKYHPIILSYSLVQLLNKVMQKKHTHTYTYWV